MKVKELDTGRLRSLRGLRSREVIAHELRKRGHGTDAKAIWRYETGRSQPNARVLGDYAIVLGASSVDDLYGDDEESRSMRLRRIRAELVLHGRDDLANDLLLLTGAAEVAR